MPNTREREYTFKGPNDHHRQMRVLKNRGRKTLNQADIISLCLQGTMSRCSQIGVWDKQSICFFSEESMTSSRCMYWIETINGPCDCMEAQRFSRGESVDLKKFRKDKIRRSILGNKEVWDESKILDQIKTIFERKRSKYEMVDIQILQTRYNDGTLASTTTLTEPLFDSEWEVYYTSQGNFLKDLTQEHIEEQIRGAHDIDCMVNLLVKHEEIHDKFRYNKKTDVEMSDIMQEYWGLLGMSIAYVISFLGLILAYVSYKKHKKNENPSDTAKEK